MQTPLVEMDGDEMTRILWQIIKDELLTPYLELNTEYYDLGLEHRNETDDQVTIDAAEATKKYGVAVKCATITPNAARMEEYDLKKMYKSPNGTIRAILDGTVFRAPIVVKGIEPCVKNWVKPITLARHAYGDIYKNTEFYIDKPGDAYLVFEGEDGEERKELIQHFDGAGVLRGMHNLDDSVKSFARSCFNYALDTKQDVWFGSKDTISKTYDGRFKEIFQQIFDAEFKDKFEEAGLTALLAPVNESLWEHVKILYWPCLLSGVLLVRREPESLGARAFSLLLSAAVMLGVGYLYHVVLEGDSLFFDVALYVLVMAAFFLLPCFLRTPVWSRTRLLWAALVLALGTATFVFTWCPPDGLLFRDLSLPAIYSLPC